MVEWQPRNARHWHHRNVSPSPTDQRLRFSVGRNGHPFSCANTRSASSSMPIQRSLRIGRTHSFDALRCAESSKRLPKISIVLLIAMFRRPPVIVVFVPSRLRTLNEMSFKQHDKRGVIGSKVNGSPRSTADPAFLLRDGPGSHSFRDRRIVLLRCRSPLLAQSGHG